MARLYGLFADLSHRQVLVVGGGEVAERKVSALLQANADLIVGAATLTPHLADWAKSGRIRHLAGSFEDQWLDDCWLVVAATDEPALNRRVAEAANARQMFVNVVDDTELATFHVPAIVDRGPLQIAISTGGGAPALGRRVRAEIEKQLSGSVGALIALATRFRDHIKARFPDMADRRDFYEQLADGDVAACLERHDEASAKRAMWAALNAPEPKRIGQVTLIGAGPGDPGLLTLNAMRALQNADVVLYDRLVSADILDLARRDASFIPVGKAPGNHYRTQERINKLLIEEAGRGRHVVRVKGGDPFIFGRGGEEIEALRTAGIPYSIVPGVTAASACAAYAGIPLTHRDHAQSVRFVTAHCKESANTLDWQSLASAQQTLAIYMGVAQLGEIQRQLLAHGRAPQTPFALIEQGTRPEQRVVLGELSNLQQKAKSENISAPAMLIVGEVAALGKTLAWFGAQPPAPQSQKPSALAPLETLGQQQTGLAVSG